MNEEINIDFENLNFEDFNIPDGFENYGADLAMSPWMESFFIGFFLVINLIGIIAYISSAIGLFLINKKLGEKHAWLSFVPIIQIYNYFTASQKSWINYLLYPVIALIVGAILAIPTFGISLIIAYIYFFVMWIKLLHAISIRTGRGVGTTIGLIFVAFIMLPIIGFSMKDKSNEKKSNNHNEKDEVDEIKNEL